MTNIKTKEKRDDFSPSTKETLKLRAAYICSNPVCRRMTIAPSLENEDKVQYIGLCAHITAAIKGGPRYDASITGEERSSFSNGIFLCSNCATQIDKNNGIDFSIDTLKTWKTNHEKWIIDNLNKSLQTETNTINVTSTNQVGGIIANVVNVNSSQIEKLDTAIEHDKSIFNKAEELLNEESLRTILDKLMGNESIKANDIDKIESLKFYYAKSSNQYINSNIETSKKNFLISLQDLNSFLGTDFDMWPYSQKVENYTACMNPQVNIDRGADVTDENFREHHRLQNLLYSKCNSLQDTYDLLRREIKITLHI